MKSFFILILLTLTACGKSGPSASSAIQKPITGQCINTTLPSGGWAFSNPGGLTPILGDCGNGMATFTVTGVTAPAVPANLGATNGMIISSIGGVCAGQVGALRTPNFSELYFIIGTTTVPVTFFATLTGSVESLTMATEGQIYTIANAGYSCKVSFVGGVPTYH